MKYMVMECHPAYAVVLDESGKFSKVANMRYQVGQTVTDVTEVTLPQSTRKTNVKWLYSIVAAAACLLMILVPSFVLPQMTYASVYMTINPEVRIDVNRKDMVVGLAGVNPDGETLTDGYDYRRKDLDVVVDELVDRAIDMGFLHSGGQITLELDAEDNEWVLIHSDSLNTHLNEYLTDKLTVTIEITDKNTQKITIPIDSDGYSESDYGPTEPSETTQTDAPSTAPAQPDVSATPGTIYSDDGQTDYDEADATDDLYDDDADDLYDDDADDLYDDDDDDLYGDDDDAESADDLPGGDDKDDDAEDDDDGDDSESDYQ